MICFKLKSNVEPQKILTCYLQKYDVVPLLKLQMQEVKSLYMLYHHKLKTCEEQPNNKREYSMVRIFLDWIWRDIPYLFVFSPNVGKYGPEKTQYLDTFHAVNILSKTKKFLKRYSKNAGQSNLFKIVANWQKSARKTGEVHLMLETSWVWFLHRFGIWFSVILLQLFMLHALTPAASG